MQMRQSHEYFVKQIELIKESEARLYQFLEQMPVGVFIIDKNYNIVFSNKRSNEILGLSFIENINFPEIKNYLELYKAANGEQEYPFHELPIVRALKEEKIISEQMKIINPHGQPYKLKVLAQPIYIKGNIEFALALYDILPKIQNNILTELLNFDFSNSFHTFIEFATRLLCEYLGVHRVGIWKNETSYIECIRIYDKYNKAYQSGMQLFKKDFPIYFDYILQGNMLPIENAITHEATREFAEIYFEPLKIYSTFDCSILVHNQLYGIICCEVRYHTHQWNETEVELMQSFSKLLGLLIEKYY